MLAKTAVRTDNLPKFASKVQKFADKNMELLPLIQAACAPGCSYCCHRIVEATLPEVIAIAQHVARSFSTAERNALQERTGLYQTAMVQHNKQGFGKFREPCPFLVEDMCSVYEHRPLSCRGLFSTDALLCEKWKLGETSPPFDVSRVSLATSVSEGIIEGTHEEGLPSGAYDLSASVDCVLIMGPAAWDRRNITAPVERCALVSALNDGKLTPSEGLSGLLKTPRVMDLWDASREGDTDTVFHLLPKFQDEALTKLVSLMLPSLYETQDDLEENWSRVLAAAEDFENASLDPFAAFERLPLLSTFFWPYAGKNVKPLLQRVMKKIHSFVAAIRPELVQPLPHGRRPGPFRLGYLSSRMTNFNGSRWAAGWLVNHSSNIETFAFNFHQQEDAFTNIWRRHADHYFHFPIPPLNVADLIRSMDLDALIFTDLGMGRFDCQLSTLRLARRQFTAWGHPVTSGSPEIDGYLSSVLMEPEDSRAHYTEQLFLLPRSGLCYPRVEHAPVDVDPAHFGLPDKGFYFQAQMASKALPMHDHIFREISEASGKPIVFLEPTEESNREKLANRLRAAKVNAVIVPRLPVGEFLGLMAKADAVLDTPAWNGGNTTIDALNLGKPVVTLGGEFMRGRHTLAFATIAGAPGLIAKDLEDYVALALDKERQTAAIEHLNASALYEDVTPVHALDQILLTGAAG